MVLVILNIKNDVYLNSFEHYDILISMSIKWPSIIYINLVMRTGIYLEILTDKYLIHHNPLRNAHTGRIRKNIFFTITKWGVKSDRFLYIKKYRYSTSKRRHRHVNHRPTPDSLKVFVKQTSPVLDKVMFCKICLNDK